MDVIEEQKDKLNLEIRKLCSLIDLIDGKQEYYQNYEKGTLSTEEYLQIQIELIERATSKLKNIFEE